MARPKKATVEYFPHYVSNGKSLFAIENRFGNDGYSFWFKLLEILGSSEHHFMDCNDISMWEYLLAKTKIEEEKAKQVLDLLAKLGCINEILWKVKIIRSDKFIENLEVVYKRREVDVINNEEVAGLCKQKLPPSEVDVNIKPQSKVKGSKEEESKGKKSKFAYTEFSEAIQPAIDAWLEYKDYKYKDVGFKSFKTILQKAITEHGENIICNRFDEAMAGGWIGLNFDKIVKKNNDTLSDEEQIAVDKVNSTGLF